MFFVIFLFVQNEEDVLKLNVVYAEKETNRVKGCEFNEKGMEKNKTDIYRNVGCDDLHYRNSGNGKLYGAGYKSSECNERKGS